MNTAQIELEKLCNDHRLLRVHNANKELATKNNFRMFLHPVT